MKKFEKITENWVSSKLPKRPKYANKGTFGKVLVIAGSKNYPGAAYLSCAAAYRVGAGLVTLATTKDIKIIVSRKLPEVTFLLREVENKLLEYDVVLIGPGLGKDDRAREVMKAFCTNYSNNRYKTVIDGDGLSLLAQIDNWWIKLSGELVLTPHPGEMSRLTGLSVDEIQGSRNKVATHFAKKWSKIVILKGAKTVIAAPSGEVKISPFANPLLATAGTGDVLAGVVAGLLAQGLKPFEASCIGVYIHGLAGKLLRKKIGDSGALASDLLPLLPKTIRDLKS